MMNVHRKVQFLTTALFISVLLVGAPVQAQSNTICFAEVPDCISGRFAEYWQQNGGLSVFGFPIGPAVQEQQAGGTFLVQPFERNRFELHPENGRPYDVLLGRLGDDRLRQLGRPWESEPPAPATTGDGCVFFEQTRHLVCGPLLSYWRNHGLNLDGRGGFTSSESLGLFGLPLTEATTETGSDGQPYLIQWFERARFELHPEIGPDTVLLGLLGRETVAGVPPAPAPTSPPASAPDACADAPTSPDGDVVPACLRGGDIFIATARGLNPGQLVELELKTPNDIPVELGLIHGPPAVDNNGAYPVKAAVNVNAPPGLYELRVNDGEKTAVVVFKIVPYAPGAPPFDNSQIPPAKNATVSQLISVRGTPLSFMAEGFEPREPIAVYGYESDGTLVKAEFTLTATGDGRVDEPRLRFVSENSDPVGIYSTTFEGLESKRTATVYFRILP
jgi:hypothetical protein